MVIDLTRRLAANPPEPVARPRELCSRWRRDPAAPRCPQRTAASPNNAPPRARHLRITPGDLRGTSAEQATQPRPTGTGGKRRGICLKPYGGCGRCGINRDTANPGGAW